MSIVQFRGEHEPDLADFVEIKNQTNFYRLEKKSVKLPRFRFGFGLNARFITICHIMFTNNSKYSKITLKLLSNLSYGFNIVIIA